MRNPERVQNSVTVSAEMFMNMPVSLELVVAKPQFTEETGMSLSTTSLPHLFREFGGPSSAELVVASRAGVVEFFAPKSSELRPLVMCSPGESFRLRSGPGHDSMPRSR